MFAICAAANSALAQGNAGPSFDWEDEIWVVHGNPDNRTCAMGRHSHIAVGQMHLLIIAKGAEAEDAMLTVQMSDHQALEIGEPYVAEIDFRTDNTIDNGWGEKPFVAVQASDDDLIGLQTNLRWDDLAEDLENEQSLHVTLAQGTYASFDLRSSRTALQWFKKCLVLYAD